MRTAPRLTPCRGLLDGIANVVVDSVELLRKVDDVAREPSGEVLAGSLTTTVGFHADHLNDSRTFSGRSV